MKNETVTLSQEPVAWANWKVGTRSYVPYRTREQAEACVRGSEIAATQLGPYKVVPLYAAALADPVPPAGGEPEVKRWFANWGMEEMFQYSGGDYVAYEDHADIVTRLQERLEEYEAENLAVRAATQEKDYSIARLQAELREMDDENTRLLNESSRLQAEVEEHKKQATYNQEAALRWLGERDALQSELTKARELLSESLPALEQAASAFKAAKPVRNKVRAYLANQSAPAAKDDAP